MTKDNSQDAQERQCSQRQLTKSQVYSCVLLSLELRKSSFGRLEGDEIGGLRFETTNRKY